MGERIYIGVAWPYANSSLHLGQIAGAYLPPDIFARYHRTKGNEVLMVTGSDIHGTPITISAEREGKTPAQIADKYHQQFIKDWQQLGISFDLYTSTGTANHAEVTQDIFLTLFNKGYIYKNTVQQAFCAACQRFLPDRYIEGTCPHCGFNGARGDQCDQCGQPLNSVELIEPRCGICGTTPEFKDSEHFFLKLTAFQDRLLSWVKKQKHWRPNVLNFTTSYLKRGLKDRAITRDIDWGIPLPLDGYPGKRIYVWFEAVIGYLSASEEWAKSTGNAEKWRDFWQGEKVKSYYFIGKDNIPFHTIIWPAMLMGYGGLNLPYDVPANEYLTIEGKKLSSSRNWAVWLPDYLSRYAPDPLRYLLSINMPETGDTDFSWHEFVRRNNDEPVPGELDCHSQALIEQTKNTLNTMDRLLYQCHFREAIRSAMSLAQETNRYLDEKSPWKIIKQNRQASATALYIAISVLSGLRTALYPFLPFSSQRLHKFLGFKGSVADDGWQLHLPQPGQKLLPPEPLFSKLDEELVAEETARLGHAN